jgi:serine phosphatase RsbU (regulator of sigma subunit)
MFRLTKFILIVLFLFNRIGAQPKNKDWMLVDSVDITKLSGEDQQVLNSILPLIHKATHDTIKLRLINELIESCGNENVWPRYNRLMLKIASQNGTDKTYLQYKANALHNMGFQANYKGNIKEALYYFDISLGIEEQIGDKNGIASSYLNLAYVFQNQGDIPKAIDYLSRSLKLNEEIKDLTSTALALNNLGVIYDYQGDSQKAIEYYARALNIYETLSRSANKTVAKSGKRGVAVSYINLAGMNKTEKDSAGSKITAKQKAIRFVEKSIAIFTEISDEIGMAGAYNTLGSLSMEVGELKKAETILLKAIDANKKLGDKQGMSNAFCILSSVYLKAKDIPKAKEAALKSLEIAKELNYPENIRNASDVLYHLYKKENNPSKSLEMYELFVQMRDSINNETTRKTSLKQQFKYEYEKKETELKARSQIEKEKMQAISAEEKLRQNVIIFSVSFGLLLVAVFSIFMYKRFLVTQKQKQIIEQQKTIVDEKNKEILDSIHYAERIQKTLLANKKILDENTRDHFIFFRSKDIVSGDFYWAAKKDHLFYLAVCDSTGHGVPGAFMSLLNIGFLSEAINEKGITEPNLVFNYVRKRLTDSISQDGQKDGMDGILLCIDQERKTITYSAAHNRPVLISNGELKELATDKMPVGIGEVERDFVLHGITISVGDTLYLYTDGFADQFGGAKGKKYKYKQLNELLISISALPMQKQREELEQRFIAWKGELEQVDDVCVIGLKI